MMLEETNRCLCRWRNGPLPLFLYRRLGSGQHTALCSTSFLMQPGVSSSCPAMQLKCGALCLAPNLMLMLESLCCAVLAQIFVCKAAARSVTARELQLHLSVVTTQGKAGRWPRIPLRSSLPHVGKVINHQILSSDTLVKEQVGIS